MKFVLVRGFMGMLIASLMTACVPLNRDGKQSYVIFGFGVVRVSNTNCVTVVNATSVGIYAGDGRLNIGASSVYVAKVPTNSETVLEFRK